MDTQINEISRMQSVMEVLEEYLSVSDNVNYTTVTDCIMQLRMDLIKVENELDEFNSRL